MNLVAKEFMAANQGRGSLVLRRFAGAADELKPGALLVDPRDVDSMALALRRALAMPSAERAWRLCMMQTHLREHDVHRRAASFLRAPDGYRAPGVRPAVRQGVLPTPAARMIPTAETRRSLHRSSVRQFERTTEDLLNR